MNKYALLAVTFAACVLLYLVFFRRTSGFTSEKSWTVYGTDGCGWTRKQLKEMDDKGVPYTYVNCENEDCGDARSYPTLKSNDGETKVGFTTF